MTGWLRAYRVLATTVGVLLIPLFAGWGLQLFAAGDLNQLGEQVTHVLGPIHGMLYMLFFVTAVILAYTQGWDLPFTVVTLLCGTIVFLSFWAEHRATARVRAEHEIVGTADQPV